MAPKGFKSMTIREETLNELSAIRDNENPHWSLGGIIDFLIDEYKKNRCPECGKVIVKRERNHRC